uniref:Endosome-associated-trafficking regulator 1 n=1 Tax=Neogobius melanostomus TaxID=47308 RepID=A0A8C6U2S6_9GOBI
MSGARSRHRTLIITDDEEESVKEEEQNPFSFKEFLRSKNLDSDPDQDPDQEQDQDQDQPDSDERPLEELEGQAWGRSWVSGGGVLSGSLAAEQEEEVTRFDSLLHEDDEDDDEDQSRRSYEGDDETSILDQPSSTSLLQVKQENQQLKKTIAELRQESVRNHSRAAQLSEELLQWRQREQQEALDLETMVQSVEHNLRVMTKRALKAEATVAKLRTELKQLQVQAEQVQAENVELRASESTMKQNALTASEKLQETASHAHHSVRRLLSEAESLKFVSELLRSIDRMSSVH